MSITRINNNVAAIRATRNLNTVGDQLGRNIERLSTGLRIIRAGDDAAGLTIRERLRTQIRGTDQAIQNSQTGINFVNTTEAQLDSLVSSMQRVRELSIQAGNTGTLDSAAIQAIQDEVFQHIDEINRIANTARFSTRQLFTGDNANITEVRDGQDELGINISRDPNASNLKSGTSILNIVQTEAGQETLLPHKQEDGQAIFATGVRDATDIAVTTARFELQGTTNPVLGTTALTGVAFDGISLVSGDIISFQGVLSDGKTSFSGSISVGAANTMAGLQSQLQTAIDNAEAALFGGVAANIPSNFVQTYVSLGASSASVSLGSGRFRFLSAFNGGDNTVSLANTAAAPSQFNVGFTVISNGGDLRARTETTRDFVSGQQVGGQIGNFVQAVTGSTFDTGIFDIEVLDVVPPARNEVETTIAFRDSTGNIATRNLSLASTTNPGSINGTFVNGVYTLDDSGINFAAGDTIAINGANVDGSTFETIFTITTNPADDADLGDGQIATLGGLIDELNYRDRSRGVNGPTLQSGFSEARATLTGNGTISLIDDVGQVSQSSIGFTIDDNDSTMTIVDKSELIIAGTHEEATIQVDGGPRQRVRIGDTIELSGPEPTIFGEGPERLIMRVGAGFRSDMSDSIFNNGTDRIDVIAQEYVGRLNGGPLVTFQNGDSNVFFESGQSDGVAETILLDFDAILDITGPPLDGSQNNGAAILLSTVNNALNFQVGPFRGQDLQFNIPDLRADNLGFGRDSGRTIMDINVTTVEGVNEALSIIDRALDQVSRTRTVLGAFTNRLEGTISSLSVSSENLSASESAISDIDISSEVSKFSSNQIVFQAGTSVLAQANFLPQGLLSLLG